MLKKTIRNQKGFTLIEIIAVLVILGILAAVAIPKYLSMADEARVKAAQGAIAEVKGRLASAQAKYMMANAGTAPNSATLYTYATGASGYGNATNLANVGTDFTVTTNGAGAPINIVVSAVQGTALTTNVTGTFNAAGD
jgi:prepilin-type N-terminal cleavage/methylation domain-containing protein